MEPHKHYEELRYSPMETRNEGLAYANQRFFHDPSNSVNTNARPPDFTIPVSSRPVLNYSIQTGEEFALANQRFFQDPSYSVNTNARPPDISVPVRARPVLNYSIQTGEEFALEFMRERVNSRQQHVIPNISSDSNTATTYTELKGVLGASHAGSESGSDFSVVSSRDKGRIQESERRDSFINEDKGNYQSIQSVPHNLSRNESNRHGHGFASSEVVSGNSSTKVKFLCSFGGKILPRPSDGKLRYVGGETRILRISKGISWEELMQKAVTIYSQTRVIKYQFPGEDLDALVSVSCDEDLENMMEECNVLEDGGSQKLRIFLFSSSDVDDSQMDQGSVDGDSEIQYVVAVNGMDLGSRMNSIGLGSTSGNNLDELMNLNVEREKERVAGKPVGVVDSPLTASIPSTNISAQTVVPATSNACESYSQAYHGQMVDHAGEVHMLPSLHPSTVPSSVPLQYSNVINPPTYAPVVENLVRTPLHGHMPGKEGSGQQPTEKLPSSIKEEKVKRESLVHTVSRLDRNVNLEKEVPLKEAKVKRDGSFQKMSEPGKISILEKEYTNSLHPHDSSLPKVTAEMGAFLLPAENHKKHDEPVRKAISPGALKEANSNTFDDNDHFNASGKPFAPGYGEFKADSAELSHLEQQVLPQRVFHSERIPREQAELNRLSKSEDSFDPQVILSHVHYDLSQQILESEDELHKRNIASQLEQTVSSVKLPHMNQTVDDAHTQPHNYHEAVPMSSTVPEEGFQSKFHNPVLKPSGHTPVDGHESARVANNYLFQSDIDKETFALKNPVVSLAPSGKLQENSASRSDVSQRGEITSEKNNVIHDGSFAQVGNPVRAPSQVESAHSGTPEQGDILIDINDRFPPDFLSDVFSKARNAEDVVGIHPLHGDGTGLSLNMENHEPKRWSFFQKLVQSDFPRKDVSLMDQDHLGFSLSNKENGASMDYSFPPLRNEGVALSQMDSHVDYEASFQPQSSKAVGPTIMTLHPEDSQFSANQSSQLDDLVNPKGQETDKKDEKLEMPQAPLVDLSPDDIDLSTLQKYL